MTETAQPWHEYAAEHCYRLTTAQLSGLPACRSLRTFAASTSAAVSGPLRPSVITWRFTGDAAPDGVQAAASVNKRPVVAGADDALQLLAGSLPAPSGQVSAMFASSPLRPYAVTVLLLPGMNYFWSVYTTAPPPDGLLPDRLTREYVGLRTPTEDFFLFGKALRNAQRALTAIGAALVVMYVLTADVRLLASGAAAALAVALGNPVGAALLRHTERRLTSEREQL